MSVTDVEMDGLLEITIPVEQVRYRDWTGVLKHGLKFKDPLVIQFQDGTQAIIPSPLKNLEIHDPIAGHGLMVFQLEQSPPNNEDGNVVHEDRSSV